MIAFVPPAMVVLQLARHPGLVAVHAPTLAAIAREELAVASARLSLRVRYKIRGVVKKIADRF